MVQISRFNCFPIVVGLSRIYELPANAERSTALLLPFSEGTSNFVKSSTGSSHPSTPRWQDQGCGVGFLCSHKDRFSSSRFWSFSLPWYWRILSKWIKQNSSNSCFMQASIQTERTHLSLSRPRFEGLAPRFSLDHILRFSAVFWIMIIIYKTFRMAASTQDPHIS